MQSKTPLLFDEIYNAALQGDISTLANIYKRNQTLDVCYQCQTPSSRLAAEGNTSALKHLQNFPLNINWVAMGLAWGGYVEAALACVAERGADINEVARGLAGGGYVEAALACVAERGASINWVARGLACGGYVEAALACVAERGASINWVARGLAAGGYCRTNSILLRTLQVCHTHDVRKKLVIALGQIKSTVITLAIELDAQTLTLSNKIAERILNYHLSFNQAEAWLTNKDLRMMLLYFRPNQLVFVHPECFYLVCQQLCHGNLALHEIKNLHAQVRFNLEDKAPLVRALEEYCGTGIKRLINRFFTSFIDHDAVVFLANCKSVSCKQDLVELLELTLERIKTRELDRDGNPRNDRLINLLREHLTRLTESNPAKVIKLSESDSEWECIDGYIY